MENLKVVFVGEGMGAKALRGTHQLLRERFSSVRVIERISDIIFANLSEYNVAILWCPKDQEKVESFLRGIRLRSPAIEIHIFFSKKAETGCFIDGLITYHYLGRDYQYEEIAKKIISRLAKYELAAVQSGLDIEKKNVN